MAGRIVATMKDDIVVDRSPLVDQYLPPKPKSSSSSSSSNNHSSSNNGNQGETLTKKQILLQNNIALHKRYENMVLDWTLVLSDPVDEATLGEAANRIKQSHYQEIIDERNISKFCGYPLCSEPPRDLKGKFRISLNERKVFDITVLKKFCSSRCLSASRWFESQLTEEPLYMMDVDADHLKVTRVSIVPLGVELADFQARSSHRASVSNAKPTPAYSLPDHPLENIPSTQTSGPPPTSSPSLGNEYVQSLLASVPDTPSSIKIVERETIGVAPSEPLDMSGLDQEMQDIFGEDVQGQHDSVDGFRVPVDPKLRNERVDTKVLEMKMSQITLAGGQQSHLEDISMRRTASSSSMDTRP